jgi:hypothetical protein
MGWWILIKRDGLNVKDNKTKEGGYAIGSVFII